MRKEKGQIRWELFLFIGCLIVFLLCTGYLVVRQKKDTESRLLFRELSEIVHKEKQNSSKQQTEESLTEEAEGEKNRNLTQMKKKNKDFVGWITIAGTTIDYPVVKRDNSFYLTHDFYKKKSRFGVPFLDETCSIKEKMMVIYGHHIRGKQMFGALVDYEEKNYYENHKKISWFTEDGACSYQIVRVLKLDVNQNENYIIDSIHKKNEKEFQVWKQETEKLTILNTGEELEEKDAYIMLVTCEYSVKDGRLLILAKRE